jgi:hypothetical protein
MGAVPIIAHSTLDGLYAGLPVVLVDDWDAVDEALLQEAWKQYADRLPDGMPEDAVMADTWLSTINATTYVDKRT